MKASSSFLVVSALVAFTSVEATPVAKVVELLTGLQQKITSEGEESEKVYAASEELCNNKGKDIGFAIETGKREEDGLKAAIAKEASKIEAFGAKVDELTASAAEAAADLKAAQEVRAKEATDFSAEEKELLEVISTLERAIGLLEKELRGASASAAMLQVQHAKSLTDALQAMVQASVMSSADASRLAALTQTSSADQRQEAQSDDAALGAPDAAVYASHTGGIVETLNGLLDQAHDQLAASRKKELATAHNFQMLSQSLTDEIKFSNKDLAAVIKGRAVSGQAKASATSDLQVTSNTLAKDNADLAALHEYCASAADDYASETKSRAEELDALKAAIAAISGATGAAAKTYTSLIQRSASAKGFQTARFLRELAHGRDGSAELAQLASRVSSTVRLAARIGSDPFGKVKGLIADMIARLESSANAEATHKAYCDKELADTTASKTDKAADIDKLSSQLDKMSARSAVLKEEVATLQKELADLAASQVEMNKVRNEEKAIFQETKPELEAGIQGVQSGMKILKEYYAASESGSSGAVTSILGFLEVIESDFSKTLVERTSAEESAQSEYAKMSNQNTLTKTAKEQDVAYKTKEITTLAKDSASTSSDREGLQTELDSVYEYLAQLEKMCIAKPETYSERAARRTAELAGLKEALQVLEGESSFVQHGALRGVKRHM